MNIDFWKKTVKKYNRPINQLLDRLSGQKTSIKLADSLIGDEKETLKLIKDYRLLKSIEENFQVEIIVGFKGDWSDYFAESMYGTAPDEENEIAERVYDGISEYLLEVLSASLENAGFEFLINSFNRIDPENSKSILNLKSYYISIWSVTAEEQDDSENELEMFFALSAPNDEVIERYSELSDDHEVLFGPDFESVTQQIIDELRIHDSGANGTGKVKVNEDTGANVEFEPFEKSQNVINSKEIRNIDLLKDVEMNVSVELGRKRIALGKILQLMKGSVVELDKLAGEPVDILVNGRTVAVGDVVVIDEHFGVRISKLLAAHESIKSKV
ncbi:MAG: flagellar motor switch protein FliN [Balneolaceae bacterium]